MPIASPPLANLFYLFVQVVNVHGRMPERDFAGTPYVPVYVMLPVSLCGMFLAFPFDGLRLTAAF